MGRLCLRAREIGRGLFSLFGQNVFHDGWWRHDCFLQRTCAHNRFSTDSPFMLINPRLVNWCSHDAMLFYQNRLRNQISHESHSFPYVHSIFLLWCFRFCFGQMCSMMKRRKIWCALPWWGVTRLAHWRVVYYEPWDESLGGLIFKLWVAVGWAAISTWFQAKAESTIFHCVLSHCLWRCQHIFISQCFWIEQKNKIDFTLHKIRTEMSPLQWEQYTVWNSHGFETLFSITLNLRAMSDQPFNKFKCCILFSPSWS